MAGSCEGGDEIAGYTTVERILSSRGAACGPLEMPFRVGSQLIRQGKPYKIK